MKVIPLFILGLITVVFVNGQTTYRPRTENYSRQDYHAASQNWSLAEGKEGFIYAANHLGLLEYDGVSWKFYPMPEGKVTRAVAVGKNGRIYTGGYMELGYWKRNVTGDLEYTSLDDLARPFFFPNIEFWSIIPNGDKVYFYSFSRILVLEDNKISMIDFDGYSDFISEVNGDIYFNIRNRGIFKLNGDTPEAFIMDDQLKDKNLRFLLPEKNGQFLVGTNSNGLYIVTGNSIKEWNPEFNEYFKKTLLNKGIVTSRGYYILGTISDGIVALDKDGKELFHLNITNGLQDNTVLGLLEDSSGNVWLALDMGIDFVTIPKNRSYSVKLFPGIGAVYDAAKKGNDFYLATNQGLMYRPYNQADTPFKLVPGTLGQVWDCYTSGNNILVGQNEGTFLVNGGKAKQISSVSGGFSLTEDLENPGYLIQSTYNNLAYFKPENGGYVFKNRIQNFSDLIRYIEMDYKGYLWASQLYRGIYKLELNARRDSVIKETYYGEKSVFHKDNNINVFKLEDRIVFTTGEKLYTYDDLKDSIVLYRRLNEALGEFQKATRIIAGPNHHYWLISDKSIGLFDFRNNNIQLIKFYPVAIFKNLLIQNFQNIYPLSERSAILCLENGYALLDATEPDFDYMIQDKQPTIRSMTAGGRIGVPKRLPVGNTNIILKYNKNNLQIQYSFPVYTTTELKFRYLMKGLDNAWSQSFEKPIFNFNRLPNGNYTLLVKAADDWGNESRPSQLKIKVLQPWYLSTFAKICIAIIVLLISLVLRQNTINQTRKREKRKQEEKEKELIRLRNEKLRNDVEFKSKELANSTIAMVKKNEFLMELKELLKIHKEQLGSRYPDKYYFSLTDKIDKNIASSDDWQLFETNFERAHEQFLDKLRNQFTDLTPSDLKLCAFLRMNLASKEIAPLLGVSVRGVENHRYRLRKKMELDNDENLTKYLMTF